MKAVAAASRLDGPDKVRLQIAWPNCYHVAGEIDRRNFIKLFLFVYLCVWPSFEGFKTLRAVDVGMYTSDLVYIDTMYPSTGGLESQARQDQMNNLLRTLAEFQHSEYNMPIKPHLQEYLQQRRYIEELQTFLDKENHETSLRLEPDHLTAHRDTSEGCGDAGAADSSARVCRSREELSAGGAQGSATAVQMRHRAPDRSFTPGHRKSKSLGKYVHVLQLPQLLLSELSKQRHGSSIQSHV